MSDDPRIEPAARAAWEHFSSRHPARKCAWEALPEKQRAALLEEQAVALAAADRAAWRPISEADKNGKPVLIAIAGKVDPYQVVRWLRDRRRWAISSVGGSLHYFDEDVPTHAFTIPAAPEDNDDG